MNILVVDDESLIREVLKEYLVRDNYYVFNASNGKDAIELVQRRNIDLIIMDIMMPEMDGFTAARKIKEIKDIPMIMLSARDEEYDKLAGFDIGIDDYVTKPFSPKELLARIKAVLKRNKVNEKFEYEDLTVDFQARVVSVEGEEIKLTKKEYEILCYFLDNKSIALSREQLLSNVWGYDFFGELEEDEEFCMGVVTVEKFKKLLDKLPHLSDFMEDEGFEEVLH